MRRWLSYFREIPLSRVHTTHFRAAGEEAHRARRGFELSPRPRSSKIVIRKPALAIASPAPQPELQIRLCSPLRTG